MLIQYHREADRLVDGVKGIAGVQPVWLDLVDPTRDEEHLVERLLSLALPTRGEMQEIEVSARLYQANGAEFMTVTVVNSLDSDDPSVTPITFVLKGETLVTVRFKDPEMFTAFAARAGKANEIACATGSKSCSDCWRP